MNTKKSYALSIAVLFGISVFIAVMSVAVFAPMSAKSDPDPPKHNIQVITAKTPAEWERGLRGLPQPDDDHGMLFDFGKEEKHCMQNKDIPYSVDVAFYDSKWKMLNGATMLANDRKLVCSVSQARYAVEMRGGWFKDHSKKGQK